MSFGSASRKPKCATPPTAPAVPGVLRERQNVVPSLRLRVDEAIPAPILTETKDLLVEPQCTCSVSNCKIDVREAVRLDHRNLSLQPTSPRRK
jgi:hypothetical protein